MYKARPNQPLTIHEQECALTMSTLLSPLGLPLLGELIGNMHDFGKMSEPFQDYIHFIEQNPVNKSKKGSVDHSTAGAQFVWRNMPGTSEELRLFKQVIALCIASHHNSSLIDCYRGTLPTDNVFQQRMEKSAKETHVDEIFFKLTPEEKIHYSSLLSNTGLIHELKQFHNHIMRLFEHSPLKTAFHYGLTARFCLSALIEGDYTSASGNGSHESIPEPDWESMQKKLEKHLSQFQADTPINKSRAGMSQACFQAAGERMGKWNLTLPTGAGKTLASLRFAMEHARKHHLSRIVYIIPYTSILDQTAKVIQKALGEEYNNCILEHHSNLVQETPAPDGKATPWSPEKKDWYMEATQTWNVPIVLTTSVQYLNALYASGKQHVRRMHSLSNAVVIFDEVQSIPFTSLRLFEHSLDFLAGICRSTTIRCTATPPEAPTDVTQHGYLAERPIIADSKIYFDQFDRFRQYEICCNIKPANYWTLERMKNLIMEEASTKGPTLAIVNTKRLAAELAIACRDHTPNADVFHLSTNMCPAHRKEIITNHIDKTSLEKARKDGKTIVCISTRLIEAGVDVDFDVIVRSVAGLDSCIQAAGRCNRDASRPGGGRIILINPEDHLEKLNNLQELKIGKEISMNMILDPGEEGILSHQSVSYYFNEFLNKLTRTDSDYLSYPFSCSEISSNMVDALSLNMKLVPCNREQKKYAPFLLFQAFNSAARQYHPIEEETTAVLTNYGEGNECRKILSNMDPQTQDEWKIWNASIQKARAYSISLPNNILEKSLNSGIITRIREGVDIYMFALAKYDPFLGYMPSNNAII